MSSGSKLARDQRPSRGVELTLRPEEHAALARLAKAMRQSKSRAAGAAILEAARQIHRSAFVEEISQQLGAGPADPGKISLGRGSAMARISRALKGFEDRTASLIDLSRHSGVSYAAVASTLRVMTRNGQARRIDAGVYQLV
jgi:hypothetical protein